MSMEAMEAMEVGGNYEITLTLTHILIKHFRFIASSF